MTSPAFDTSLPYRLSPSVALRPEPFGALAYHFGNRRLSFLKAPELVELVRGLAGHPSAGDALADVPEGRRDAFRHALAALAEADMIVQRHCGASDCAAGATGGPGTRNTVTTP